MTVLRTTRWTLGVTGVLLMTFAGWGVFHERSETAPVGLALWLGAGVLAHDLLLAPLLLAVGWLVVRVVPAPARGVVAVGLATAGTLLLVGVPVVLASRRDRANPSILPLPYVWTLLACLGVVTLLTAVAAVVALRRRGRG